MEIAIKSAKLRFTIVLVLLLFSLLILSTVGWSTQYSKEILSSNLHTTGDLYERVKEYKKIIKNMNEQIKVIMDEMDWLYLNMERIKDSEREIPHKFFVSIKEKKYNIRRLRRERSRYYKLVKSYLNEINSRVLKQKKYSAGQSTPEGEDIQEETIQDQQTAPDSAASSKSGKAGKKAGTNEYFEKLSSETKRFENLLDKYSALLDQRAMESMPGEKPSTVQDVNIEEEHPDKTGLDRSRLSHEIREAGLSDWIEISDSGTCLTLKTTLPILFPMGSAEIAKEYKSFFKRFANLLKAYNVQIMVHGYADIDPIHTSKYPSNFELGAIRAANVVHEFVKNGLKPSIFKINSPGKYRFSANGAPTQKALERRAEVTVVFTG